MISMKRMGLAIVCWLFFCSALTAFQINTRGLAIPKPDFKTDGSSLQVHPLPPSLAQWKDVNQQGDYFESIETTPVGYLVWSQFPIKVYVEPVSNLEDNSARGIRLQQWVKAVRDAISEWNIYLPLQEVDKSELADIVIVRSSVEREIRLNPDTGLYDIPQAITAQTHYEFYVRERQQKILVHRMIIRISPHLGKPATLAAARHELGHGLGIWGHSERESDALYFSQVKNTPAISERDVNTLKKIYQQPTRLGWKI